MDRDGRRPDVHPATLRFLDGSLEAAYQLDARGEALVPFRAAALLATVVFAVVALVSVWSAPVPPGLAVPACAVMILVVLGGLAVAPRARTLDQLQIIGGVENVAAGLIAVAVPALAGELERFGPQAVGFAVLWAFAVLRLRFIAAVASVVVYVAAFTLAEVAGSHPLGLGIVLVPLYSTVIALAAAAYLLERSVRRRYFDRLVIEEQRAEIAAEKATSDRLLLNILPAPIADRLRRGAGPIADGHPEATILFADLVGFTPFAEARTPEEVVAFLDELFTAFDELTESHGLEKIKTIGDAYMAAAGVPTPVGDHATRAVALGLAMLEAVAAVRARSGLAVHLRIGVHSGRVVAGVIGRRKFSYDLWGDTVNLASRLESGGLPDRIQVSGATRDRLAGRFRLEPRGPVEVKGKGRVETWLVEGPEPPSRATAGPTAVGSEAQRAAGVDPAGVEPAGPSPD